MSTAPDIGNVELRQIGYFLAVAEHRSVSAAARELGLTQPALARAIGRLEQRLGAILLTRSSRGAVPTAAGARFLGHARMIVNDCRRAAQEVQAISSGALGNVTLCCGASFVHEMMGEVTRLASEELPTLNLTVSEGIVDEMLITLLEGRCDAVFSTFPDIVPRGPLAFEPLMTLNPTIVCGASHPLARRRALKRADLVGHRWVSMDHTYTLSVLTGFFTAERLAVPQPLRTNSLTLLKSLVASDEFLSLLPRHSVQREIRAGLVRRVAIHVPVPPPQAGLIYLERRARSAAVERVLQLIREVCARHGEP